MRVSCGTLGEADWSPQLHRREIVIFTKLYFGTGRKDPNQKVRRQRARCGRKELIRVVCVGPFPQAPYRGH